MTAQTLDESRIAEAAFHLWLAEGQPEGRDQEHWFRARTALEAGLPADVMPAPKKPRARAAKAAAAPRALKTRAG